MTDYSNSILPAAARIVIPVQYIVAFYLLMRGHNLPGGGFIGGLVLASALVLRTMVEPSRAPRFDLLTLAGIGLMCSLLSALFPMFFGLEFFTGMWGGSIWLPLVGKIKLGNVVFFDIGVFLVVTGVTAKMLLVLFSQHLERAKSRASEP